MARIAAPRVAAPLGQSDLNPPWSASIQSGTAQPRLLTGMEVLHELSQRPSPVKIAPWQMRLRCATLRRDHPKHPLPHVFALQTPESSPAGRRLSIAFGRWIASQTRLQLRLKPELLPKLRPSVSTFVRENIHLRLGGPRRPRLLDNCRVERGVGPGHFTVGGPGFPVLDRTHSVLIHEDGARSRFCHQPPGLGQLSTDDGAENAPQVRLQCRSDLRCHILGGKVCDVARHDRPNRAPSKCVTLVDRIAAAKCATFLPTDTPPTMDRVPQRSRPSPMKRRFFPRNSDDPLRIGRHRTADHAFDSRQVLRDSLPYRFGQDLPVVNRKISELTYFPPWNFGVSMLRGNRKVL
jgi:hypothetical protein